MTKTVLTIGMFDKDTESQLHSAEDIKSVIAYVLINKFDVFAFTLIDCNGYYRMTSTGNIISEPSVRVEMATDEPMENLKAIVVELKNRLNQESIMVEVSTANIEFI